MNEILKKQIDLLPDEPGCYLMHNIDNEIIYIGKAKNLKKRVSQYFLRPQSGKTQAMVHHVDHFETIITKSEKEALILEMNLIQKHHPRYNIMLMDDKHYPYIALHKDIKHPYVSLTRSAKDKKCEYFGPFPNSSAAYDIIDIINFLFPIRKCNSIPKSPCIYYHLKKCLAPCINEVTKEEYEPIIDQIRNLLKGKNSEIIREIKEKINNYAKVLDFESAKKYKTILDELNHINEKQNVEFKDKINRDFFAFHTRSNYLSLALFSYREGLLLSKRTFCYEIIGEINEFVSEIIYQYYQANPMPKEVYVSNSDIKDYLSSYLSANIFSPSIGAMHDVLSTVEINAKEALDEHFLTAKLDDDLGSLLDELGQILSIKTPLYIELFDNSHLSGTNAIGAMVAFINGEPAKSLYRKFNIQGYNTKDDLESMHETLTRRYSRLKEENQKFPDLIIVDGGKTQIEVANTVLKELEIDIPVAGLIKSDKHRTDSLMDSNLNVHPIEDKKLFFLLTRMQDEVHRYAITTHIKKRNKSVFNSIFDNIKGLGEKRKEKLVKAFPSIKELKEATLEEIKQIIPEDVANELFTKLHE